MPALVFDRARRLHLLFWWVVLSRTTRVAPPDRRRCSQPGALDLRAV